MPVTVAVRPHAHCSPLVLYHVAKLLFGHPSRCRFRKRPYVKVNSGTASVGRTRGTPVPRPSARPEGPRPRARRRAGTHTTTRSNPLLHGLFPVRDRGQAQDPVVAPQDALVGDHADHTVPRRRDIGDGLGQSFGTGQRDDHARGRHDWPRRSPPRSPPGSVRPASSVEFSEPLRSTSAAPRHPTVVVPGPPITMPRTADASER